VDEPPPLFKVWGEIDWQKLKRGNEQIIIESNERRIILWFVGNQKCKEIEVGMKSEPINKARIQIVCFSN
jgi:hypothetical protein